MMNFDLTFPASYRVEMLPEYPGGEIPNLFYFPPRAAGGTEGVVLRVTPENGGVWTGCFSPFTRTPVLIAAPQPDWLFVLADRSGYTVNTRQPSEWSWISSDAITGVQIVRDHGLILFADHDTITAYGRSGIVWRSERLCCYGSEKSLESMTIKL